MKQFLSIIFAMLFALLQSIKAQQTFTHYARSWINTTLSLQWTTNNYGSIRWQSSVDGGNTWKDISGENKPTYAFRSKTDSYVRVVVEGDKACQPIVQTHIVKMINFSVSLKSTTATTATYRISDFTLPKSEVAEWGFCRNFSNLSRLHTNMYRKIEGTKLPDGKEFDLTCTGLQPNEKYTVRVYFKTKDGSIIYGPGKLTDTMAGLKWSSEDWTITTNKVVAKFLVDGHTSAIPRPTFQFGTPGNMKTYTAVRNHDGIYTSADITGLQPATEYTATVTAVVNGHEQTISKTVRTMTDYSTYVVDNTVKPARHKIVWEVNPTRIQLSPDNIQAEYPRLLRVSSDTLLLTYHGGDGTQPNTDHWQDIYLQRSVDNGRTWSVPEKLMDHAKSFSNDAYGWTRFADPTFTRLANGWILMQFIGNANPETNYNCQVFVSISKDGGNTWGDPITVGRGRTWEPQIVQLPGGELELLVSSEAYWWDHQRHNLFQEILCARSTDNGETWTAFRRASYNPGRRDGMPVPVVLQGNKGVLFSIESINSNANPSLIYRQLTEEWDATDWNGIESSRRWLCRPILRGCAPYMIQLPTGEIVVSGHLDQRGSVWQTNRTQVTVGDNTGHNFGPRTAPFSNLPYGEGAYYNSLFLKDATTIWLAITHSVYNGTNCLKNTIEYIEGKIVEK